MTSYKQATSTDRREPHFNVNTFGIPSIAPIFNKVKAQLLNMIDQIVSICLPKINIYNVKCDSLAIYSHDTKHKMNTAEMLIAGQLVLRAQTMKKAK